MRRERLDNWCEKGILGLVLAILVFGPLATGAVRPLEFLVLEGLTIAVLLLWLARLWLARTYRLLWPPVCWGVLAFAIYALARCQLAPIEFLARQELIRTLLYSCLFFAVLNNLHRQEIVQWTAVVLLTLATAISLYAIYQFATGSDYVWYFRRPAQFQGRGSGTYICPNNLAGFLEMILPLGLAYLFAGRFRAVAKVFLGYGSLVILAGIGVTLSWGGWVATGMSLLVFFAVLVRRRVYRLPALLLLVAAVLAVGFALRSQRTFQQRHPESVVPGPSDDSLARRWLWGPAWRMWQDHFWWGVGPGHFDARFGQYRPAPFQMRGQWVHNDYLNTLTDWGLVGGGLVGAALGLLGAGVWRTWRFVHRSANSLAEKQSNRSAFVLGAGTGLVAILVHSLVDFNMQIPANAILAVTLMALLASHLRFSSDRYWLGLGWLGKGLASAVLLGALAYLAGQGVRRAREYVWLQRAKHARTAAEQIQAMQRACAADPLDFEASYNLGEVLRLLSWRGDPNYQQVAGAAMDWFQRGMRSNPYDPYNFLRYGMCLDWVGRHAEADRYLRHALDLDPNAWYPIAVMGWHYIQVTNYPTAKLWFERSLKLKGSSPGPPVAETYLKIIQQRTAEEAERKP